MSNYNISIEELDGDYSDCSRVVVSSKSTVLIDVILNSPEELDGLINTVHGYLIETQNAKLTEEAV